MGQLEDIQIFVRVVEAGGIGKAAEQLNMAKSAVSRRLSELEARLETKLIHRTTRSSHLTEAGQFYYQRSLGLMASVEEMNQRLSDEDRHLEGSLRISIPLSFGLQHLSPLLDEFARSYPKIKLYIDFSDREIDLIEEGLDMAVRISDLKDSSVQARKIAPIRFVLVASPAYLEAHGEPEDLQSLKHHQLLKYGNDELNSWRLEDEQGQKHDVSFASRIHANNGEFLREMAKAGHGIILSPTFIVWQDIADGLLVPVLSQYRKPPIYAYAVYPRNRYLSKKTRVFIDFLVAHFDSQAYWDECS